MFNFFKNMFSNGKDKQAMHVNNNDRHITPNSTQKYGNVDVRNDIRNKIEHQRFLLQEKYEKEIQLHYEYEENIEKFYKLGIYQDNIDNEYIRKCEEQCALDIQLSIILKDYYYEDIRLQNEAYNFGITDLPYYSAYKRLSQIYEKKKEYFAAIKICNLAIENGYVYENNTNDMYTRKARLEKKFKKNGCIAIIDGRKVNVETGEIIEQ